MSVEYLQLSDDVWNPDSDHSAGDNHQRRRDEQHGYKGRGGGLSGIPGHRTDRSTKNMDDRCVHIERLHSFEINQQIEEKTIPTLCMKQELQKKEPILREFVIRLADQTVLSQLLGQTILLLLQRNNTQIHVPDSYLQNSPEDIEPGT